MHYIVCRLGFAPNPTRGAYSTPPDSRAGLGGGAPGERKGGRGEEKGGDGKGEEEVPECPTPELASLILVIRVTRLSTIYYRYLYSPRMVVI